MSEAKHDSGQSLVFLSERQLAERWGLSQRTLQRWRAENRDPIWVRIGGNIRYRFEDVLAFEAAETSRGE